jgi:hypothetical protein
MNYFLSLRHFYNNDQKDALFIFSFILINNLEVIYRNKTENK